MFYYIPIEPLAERYTEQWYRWFPDELKRRKVPYTIIDGDPLSRVVETGTFLDINSTLHYKAEQLKKIAKLFFDKQIKPNDIFFVADLEFWGIESIRYLSDLNNIPVKIYGFCHAASYTREDFMSKCEPYGRYFENGWFKICDKVFVGSEYHKNIILDKRGWQGSAKIVVTGNPYSIKEVTKDIGKIAKKRKVILTNRPDYEKRPNLTLNVFQMLKTIDPTIELVATTSRAQWGSGWLRSIALDLQNKGVLTIKEGLTKNEYLTEVAESMVMTGNSIEENFGYCILEAVIFDTIPVIPNNYSHPELVPDERCLFDSIDDQVAKIMYALQNPFYVKQYAKQYENSLSKIIDLCLCG